MGRPEIVPLRRLAEPLDQEIDEQAHLGGDVLRAAALKGNGITLLPTFMVGPDIKAGRLQIVPDNPRQCRASTGSALGSGC